MIGDGEWIADVAVSSGLTEAGSVDFHRNTFQAVRLPSLSCFLTLVIYTGLIGKRFPSLGKVGSLFDRVTLSWQPEGGIPIVLSIVYSPFLILPGMLLTVQVDDSGQPGGYDEFSPPRYLSKD